MERIEVHAKRAVDGAVEGIEATHEIERLRPNAEHEALVHAQSNMHEARIQGLIAAQAPVASSGPPGLTGKVMTMASVRKDQAYDVPVPSSSSTVVVHPRTRDVALGVGLAQGWGK